MKTAKKLNDQLILTTDLMRGVDFQGDEAILDLGCGNGRITASFAKNLPHSRVLGIDRSAEMIALANHTYRTQDYPNLEFQQVADRSLYFDEEFDFCFSQSVCRWTDNHQIFLQEVSQVLRSGGCLIAACTGENTATHVVQIFAEVIERDPWQQYFQNFWNTYSHYNDKKYALEIEQNGFKLEQLRLLPQDLTYPGREGLTQWIRQIWTNFINCVPIDLQDHFIGCFVDRYLEFIPLDRWGYAHVATVQLETKLLKL
jgi:trans-aconitate 2-methyltransferase